MAYDLLVRMFVKTDGAERAEQVARETVAFLRSDSIEFAIITNLQYWKLPELREVGLTVRNDEYSLFDRVRDTIGDNWEEKNAGYDRLAVLATRARGKVRFAAIDWAELSWVPRAP